MIVRGALAPGQDRRRLAAHVIEELRGHRAVVGEDGGERPAGVARLGELGLRRLRQLVPAERARERVGLHRKRQFSGRRRSRCNQQQERDVDREGCLEPAPLGVSDHRRDDEHGRGHVGGSRPVGVRPRDEGFQRDDGENWKGEGEQEAVGLGQGLPPGAPRDDQVGAEQDRAEDTELRAEKFQRLTRIEERSAPIGILRRVRDGGEAVGVVPGDVGRDQEQPERQRQIQAVVSQHRAALRREEQIDRRAHEEPRHRVLGVEPHAERETKHEPGPQLGRLEQGGKAPQRQRPAHEQRRVGRNQSGRQRDAGQRREREARQRARARIIKPAA